MPSPAALSSGVHPPPPDHPLPFVPTRNGVPIHGMHRLPEFSDPVPPLNLCLPGTSLALHLISTIQPLLCRPSIGLDLPENLRLPVFQTNCFRLKRSAYGNIKNSRRFRQASFVRSGNSGHLATRFCPKILGCSILIRRTSGEREVLKMFPASRKNVWSDWERSWRNRSSLLAVLPSPDAHPVPGKLPVPSILPDEIVR